MCLDNDYLDVVKRLKYIPVGLKNKNFSNEWLLDNTKDNISHKNPYYGEYTFYYWYWKNLLKDKKKMIGLVFVLTESYGQTINILKTKHQLIRY